MQHRGSDTKASKQSPPGGLARVSRKRTALRLVALQLVLGLAIAALIAVFSRQAALAILAGTAVSILASGVFGLITALPGENSSSGTILMVFMLGQLAKLALVVAGFTLLFTYVEILREGLYAVLALVTFLLMTLLAYGLVPKLEQQAEIGNV